MRKLICKILGHKWHAYTFEAICLRCDKHHKYSDDDDFTHYKVTYSSSMASNVTIKKIDKDRAVS